MPTKVPIEVFMVGSTKVDEAEVKRWMTHIGAPEFELPTEGVTNPAMLIALAGKRCYMSFKVDESLNPNITRIREDYVKYFDNILASGHGSVLEHSVYNFAIEGVSRVFTAEMNRHRAGWAISEGSLRFIRFGENIPYWVPDSIQGEDVLTDDRGLSMFDGGSLSVTHDRVTASPGYWSLEEKRHASRLIFARAFKQQEAAYRVLQAIWAEELAPESKFKDKKQVTSMMRRIVGLGVATGGMWSGNIRALRHVFAMRASKHAEEEMIHVFSRVVKMMADKEPLLFGDFEQDDNGYWRPRYVKV